MKIAAITPTRGDRPEFLEHCKYLMEKQTRKPDKHYIIDYPPESDEVDLIPRIRKGIEMAKADGMDYVAIIEDDDYYPDCYIQALSDYYSDSNINFFGVINTIYFHLGIEGFRIMRHPHRSSLFTTSFKIDALDNFVWPDDNEPFLDLVIWNYVKENNIPTYFATISDCIGIKHGYGKCGGNGHFMESNWYTPCKLSDVIFDQYSIDFYTKMSELCTPSK